MENFMPSNSSANYINHVVLVLDASTSMRNHRDALVKVADGQIEYLARRSQELDQETRVSIYTFADRANCLVYDKDVLRLPSIASLYKVGGMTALVDASLLALRDLAKTATLYGDHAFLTFVLTDGIENASHSKPANLAAAIAGLDDNWTVACLVPDQRAAFEAKGMGFPPANVAVWDTTSAAGVVEAGETIKRATENFMTSRSRGVRGTRTLFSTGAEAVNKTTVKAALTPLKIGTYDIFPVHSDSPIKQYVTSRGVHYTVGKSFYQLTKTEEIQASKVILIREKKTNKVYSGAEARDILGLPEDVTVKVKPDFNAEWDIFVQSTSVNRKVLKDTDLVVMH